MTTSVAVVGVQQHHGVLRLDRRGVGADVDGVEPVRTDEARLERERFEVGGLHPADRQVEAAVGDPGGLRVRRHHPGVDPQLRDPGRPLRPVGGHHLT